MKLTLVLRGSVTVSVGYGSLAQSAVAGVTELTCTTSQTGTLSHSASPFSMPASPQETWRVIGPGTTGAALAGLCGLLVSCYQPVSLTKQGPVKLDRDGIRIQTQEGEKKKEPGRGKPPVVMLTLSKSDRLGQSVEVDRGEIERARDSSNGWLCRCGCPVLRTLVKGLDRLSQTSTVSWSSKRR